MGRAVALLPRQVLLGVLIELHFEHVLDHMVENCGAIVGLRHISQLICHVEQEVSQCGNDLLPLLVLPQMLLSILDHVLDLLEHDRFEVLSILLLAMLLLLLRLLLLGKGHLLLL